YCARTSARVVAVEIDPVVAAVAAVNSWINGFRNVEVQCCDLREWSNDGAAGSQGFDLVVANPPFLPLPESMTYSVAGHGGDDGLRLIWRILELLPGILKPNGTAQIIGAGLSDGAKPMFLHRLNECARSHGLEIVVSIISHQGLRSGSELFDRMTF